MSLALGTGRLPVASRPRRGAGQKRKRLWTYSERSKNRWLSPAKLDGMHNSFLETLGVFHGIEPKFFRWEIRPRKTFVRIGFSITVVNNRLAMDYHAVVNSMDYYALANGLGETAVAVKFDPAWVHVLQIECVGVKTPDGHRGFFSLVIPILLSIAAAHTGSG